MANVAYKLMGDYRETTVTSQSYTATTTVATVPAVENGARRIFYNNAAGKIFLNRTGTTPTTTTNSIALVNATSFVEEIYFGVVYALTTSAVSYDFRVETITYNKY